MALNLKNPHTLAAIDELARISGLSKSEAVGSAIEARLAQLTAEQRTDDLPTAEQRLTRAMEIAQDTGRRLRQASGEPTPPTSGELTDALYDQDGLPA